ncbi:MAG: hypothetical protein U5L06_12395 [Rhodovibrio sp.]|nr:hypothetical protein [Rhodovibrio sp.]
MFAALDAADTGWLRKTAIKAALKFPAISWSVFKGRNGGLFADPD